MCGSLKGDDCANEDDLSSGLGAANSFQLGLDFLFLTFYFLSNIFLTSWDFNVRVYMTCL